jgi:hypothetical protein
MTLGLDECWFPERTALTAFNYGCRCHRCVIKRKRYDGARPNKPRRRASSKGDSEQTPAPTPRQPALNPHNLPPYMGPCRCPVPNPRIIPLFGVYECGNCGMPLREEAP